MQADEDVGKIALAVPVLVCELLLNLIYYVVVNFKIVFCLFILLTLLLNSLLQLKL
jgi:hypothetical protein